MIRIINGNMKISIVFFPQILVKEDLEFVPSVKMPLGNMKDPSVSRLFISMSIS